MLHVWEAPLARATKDLDFLGASASSACSARRVTMQIDIGFGDVVTPGAVDDGQRHIWWNFVSSSKERIEQAGRAWREQRFPKVPGDEIEFIPLPE
jgi:hypothetical protein